MMNGFLNANARIPKNISLLAPTILWLILGSINQPQQYP
jgi:hypothetical protein